MSLVVDERQALTSKPGLHALVVGVSRYPHLPKGDQPATPASFGMRQLSSAALTAFKVYQWLQQRRTDLSMPLASVRLLLAPSDEELAAEPGLQGLADPPTLDNFLVAANAWRQDAASHQDNVSFFYFAGHGVQRSKNDGVLLLQGFGDGIGGALRHAVDVNNLFFGMAPTAARPDIARTQLFFIDACRNFPSRFKDFETLSTTDVFDVELSGRDDRRAPVFYAAVADSKAYAVRGEQTVFSRALVRCLEIGTEDPIEDDEGNVRWPVTVQSLNEALTRHFDSLGPQDKLDQEFILGGWVKDATIVYLNTPPPVRIQLEVDPQAALTVTRLEVRDAEGNTAAVLPVPLPQNPYMLEVPAGIYRLVATIDPPTAPYVNFDKLRQLVPPASRVKVKVGP